MEIKPASKSTQEAYDPTSMEMKHSKIFSALCPGVANSGNLAYKWDVPGDQTQPGKPPEGLKGE